MFRQSSPADGLNMADFISTYIRAVVVRDQSINSPGSHSKHCWLLIDWSVSSSIPVRFEMPLWRIMRLIIYPTESSVLTTKCADQLSFDRCFSDDLYWVIKLPVSMDAWTRGYPVGCYMRAWIRHLVLLLYCLWCKAVAFGYRVTSRNGVIHRSFLKQPKHLCSLFLISTIF